MSNKGLIVGLVLVGVVMAYMSKPSSNNATTPAAPVVPSVTESEMLASSEIRCDSPAIWISRKDPSKTGKAQGFFIQIKKGKAKLFVFDLNSDTDGTLRLSGKVKKEGDAFYFENHESIARFTLSAGNSVDGIFSPDKGKYGYMITTPTANGCSISKV